MCLCVCIRNNFLLQMKKLFETSSKCLPDAFILDVSVPLLSGMALFEVSFCGMFPGTLSECSSFLLLRCFLLFCQLLFETTDSCDANASKHLFSTLQR